MSEVKSDEYYKSLLESNPYVKVPEPENVRQVVDRYEHAKKDEACWQVKWDLIHCVVQSDCVQVIILLERTVIECPIFYSKG